VQKNTLHAIEEAPYRSSATTWEPNFVDMQTLEKTWPLGVSMHVSSQLYLINMIYFSLSRNNMPTLSNNSILIPRAHTNMISRSFLYRGAVVPLPESIRGINS